MEFFTQSQFVHLQCAAIWSFVMEIWADTQMMQTSLNFLAGEETQNKSSWHF